MTTAVTGGLLSQLRGSRAVQRRVFASAGAVAPQPRPGVPGREGAEIPVVTDSGYPEASAVRLDDDLPRVRHWAEDK